MVTHFIFLSSSYSLGTRIALDYIVTDDTVQEKLKEHLDKIVKECGKDVSISTHMIQADDTTWKSVCVADHFFKDVKVIDSVDKFIKLIKKDRKRDNTPWAKSFKGLGKLYYTMKLDIIKEYHQYEVL